MFEGAATGGPCRSPVQRDQEKQEEKVSRTGLGRYLKIVLTSESLGVAKPDRRIFELAAGRLGVPPRRVVYVGDQLEVDARAATAAGLRGIWLNRVGGDVPRAAGPSTTLLTCRACSGYSAELTNAATDDQP